MVRFGCYTKKDAFGGWTAEAPCGLAAVLKTGGRRQEWWASLQALSPLGGTTIIQEAGGLN